MTCRLLLLTKKQSAANLASLFQVNIFDNDVHPNLATSISNHGQFAIYRRFGYIQARLLLRSQNEPRKLEERLHGLDQEDYYEDPEQLMVTGDDNSDGVDDLYSGKITRLRYVPNASLISTIKPNQPKLWKQPVHSQVLAFSTSAQRHEVLGAAAV